MTDAPERIWYDGVFQRARGIRHHAPESEAHPQIEYRRADLAPTLSAALALPEIAALVEASAGLKSIVEGIQGAMEHGTWRAEGSNLRMKDTDEWVTFYNALSALRAAREKE